MNYCDEIYLVLYFCFLVLIPVCFAYGFYFCWKLPPIFDPLLFNEKYWHANETFLPFYRFRRAGVYAICIGFSKQGRKRFAPYDLTLHVSRSVKAHCIVFAWIMTLSLTIPLASLIPIKTVCRPEKQQQADETFTDFRIKNAQQEVHNFAQKMKSSQSE